MLPFHHGDADPNANALQRFIDSDVGVNGASIMHSIGALLFAAGIAIYLYLAHLVRRSRGDGARPNLALLNYAHAFNLSGIVLNGIGGIMRLEQGDHPGLERLGDSTWVQLILVKHLFLVGGVGLAIYLTWRTRHLAQKEVSMPRLQRESPRMAAFALGSLCAILLAAVLGAAAGNVDLVADLARPGMDGGGFVAPPPGAGEPQVLDRQVDTGTITGVPVLGLVGREEHGYTVPNGTDTLVVTLNWTRSVAKLGLNLTGPSGGPVDGCEKTAGEAVVALTCKDAQVSSGAWSILVSADTAVEEPYRLEIKAIKSRGVNLIEADVSIPGGQEFFEANLLVKQGETIWFEWHVVDSNVKCYFDVHLHPAPGQVVYPVRGDWNHYEGNYTHQESDPGASLLWQNNNSGAIRVHYRVWGNFTVDSYAPAAP